MEIFDFDFLGSKVRAIRDNLGKLSFVFKDICDALDISNPSAAAENVPNRYLAKAEVSDPTGRMSR